MNVFELSCVSVDRTLDANKPADGWEMQPELTAFIARINTERPQWKFILGGYSYGRYLREVSIFHDGELLGTVSYAYGGGRVGHCFHIRNDRIEASRSRSGPYRTGNIDKAVLKVKQVFKAKNTQEIMESAAERASGMIANIKHRTYRALHTCNSDIRTCATEFIMSDEGWPLFENYMCTTMPYAEADRLSKTIAKRDEAKSWHDVIHKVSDMLNTGKASLVVRLGSQYLFRSKGVTTAYTDGTIPSEYRGALGLLKLVENEDFISETGCRIDEDTFVVIPERTEDDTNTKTALC